jgi:hypothetical protein
LRGRLNHFTCAIFPATILPGLVQHVTTRCPDAHPLNWHRCIKTAYSCENGHSSCFGFRVFERMEKEYRQISACSSNPSIPPERTTSSSVSASTWVMSHCLARRNLFYVIGGRSYQEVSSTTRLLCTRHKLVGSTGSTTVKAEESRSGNQVSAVGQGFASSQFRKTRFPGDGPGRPEPAGGPIAARPVPEQS